MYLGLSALLFSFFYFVTAYDNVDLRNDVVVPRQLFRPTVTVTSTSVSTITCSKSTADPCKRRKREEQLHGEDNLIEQFPIAPSAVLGVEPTNAPVRRESRAADPQLLFVSPAFDYEPQSGHYRGIYRPVALPFYVNFGAQQAAAQRFWFPVTSTSVVFSIFTYTSTPVCSTTGPFLQCPNA